MTIVYKEPGKVLVDILQSDMELEAGQVMFTNQKYFIPTDGLLVVVSYVGPGKVIANNNQAVSDGAAGLVEVQSVVMAHLIQIDIMGYGNEARTRKEEIVMALSSLYSQLAQETAGMQIARQPGAFLDTSFLEATKMVTRYTTTVLVTSWHEKQKAVGDIFTDFSRAVPPLLTVDA